VLIFQLNLKIEKLINKKIVVNTMSEFILNIEKRDYTKWNLKPHGEFSHELEPIISPVDLKLFHKDVIDNEGKVVSSFYRNNKEICGVLLTSEKTYGRNNKDKLLFKCIPDDECLPCFLIPYEEKNIGFSKNKRDKYVMFYIDEWKDKHPSGRLSNNFGNVDDKEAYLNYQLACNNLNESIKEVHSASLRALRKNNLMQIPYVMNGAIIEDRRERSIISIDPKGCSDIDDAIGISRNDGEKVISIYISNVAIMIEYLELWEFITTRVSSIYLPNKKISMFPNILSDNLCSLKEKEERVAFVLDIHIDDNNNQTCKCSAVIIKVEKNYVYNEPELTARKDYQEILETINKINTENEETYTNTKYMDKITNSHDVVEYCMLYMNHECAKRLKDKRKGIFRSATKGRIETNNTCYENLMPEIKYILQNVSGEYCNYDNIKPHELVSDGLQTYTHITSPIRRIVDCVNMIELQQGLFKWSAASREFINRWMSSIEVINKKTKSIGRLQNQMALIELYEKNQTEGRSYSGVVFSKKTIDIKGVMMFKYSVFIQLLKLLSSVVTSKEIKEYSIVEFSVHSFMDEIKMTKKFRLQLS